MLQFQLYPIYIVYSRHSQEAAEQMAWEFHVKGDKHMYYWMSFTGASLAEIREDSAPAHQAERIVFENTVKTALDSIVGTRTGRCLLNLMKPGAKFYIIPSTVRKAITRQAERKGGGGIRIGINPSDWGDGFDNTLVHELAHALRFSYSRMLHKRIDHTDFTDAEEFFATQVENIYLSELGNTKFYASYPGENLASKGTIYSTFVETPILIMALKYCLDQEEIARRLARFPLKKPDFNPFRDYEILERMALSKTQQQGMPAGKFMPL